MSSHDASRHDFNNQLGIILGFTELLLMECRPGDPRWRDLEEIRQAAVTARGLLARMRPAPADEGRERVIDGGAKTNASSGEGHAP